MRSIPEVPLERRREILSLRGGTGVHAALLAELGFDSALELVRPIAPEADRGEALRVVAWNAQRCRDPEASAALLRRTGLESHSDPDERAAQLEAVFAAIDAYAPGSPALVGGDVNTHSLGRAELADRTLLARAMERDPRRLAEADRRAPRSRSTGSSRAASRSPSPR